MMSINVTTGQHVPVKEWLRVFEEEYLDEFVPGGGATVKFISGSGGVLEDASQILRARAMDRGFLHAALDPSALLEEKKPDLHRIDRFFFALTRGVDWSDYAALQVRAYLEGKGLDVRGCDLRDFEAIAARNGRDPADLLREYDRDLATPLLTDHGLAYEFRAALVALQRAMITPHPESPTLDEVVLAWLQGKTMPGAATVLKKIHIYDRIAQRNARHMLISFCRWLPGTGAHGVVAVLDFRPYQSKKPTQAAVNRQIREAIKSGASREKLEALVASAEADNPRVFYSDAAYVQMLALLRHFIDDIELFPGFVLVVLTEPSFYDAHSPRNYNDYDALQTRIGLEVKDARRANPAAALVHLSEEQ